MLFKTFSTKKEKIHLFVKMESQYIYAEVLQQ